MMNKKNKTLIWDVPVRLFHWLLVIAIGYCWYSVEILEDMDHHFIAGYCVLTLIIFRIVWGFIGTKHARFKAFMYSPKTIFTYACTLLSKKPKSQDTPAYVGHNPLGALSVFALLFVVALQAITGLFSDDEYYTFGPLNDYISRSLASLMTEIHYTNFNIILGFVGLHICAILFYVLFKKENLITAMFTGKKSIDQPALAIKHSMLIRAVTLLIVCVGGITALVYFA